MRHKQEFTMDHTKHIELSNHLLIIQRSTDSLEHWPNGRKPSNTYLIEDAFLSMKHQKNRSKQRSIIGFQPSKKEKEENMGENQVDYHSL